MNVDKWMYLPPLPSYTSDNPNWFKNPIPHLRLNKGGKKGLIVYYHPNAMDCGQVDINYTDYEIMLVEYEGYGAYESDAGRSLSTSPNSVSIIKDVEILGDYLFRKNIEPIIIGQSIGTGPATLLASKLSFRSLHLLSPYISIPHLAGDLTYGFIYYFVRDTFHNQRELRRIRRKDKCIHLYHGQRDTIIPYSHSVTLSAHPATVLHLFDCGHNDLPLISIN